MISWRDPVIIHTGKPFFNALLYPSFTLSKEVSDLATLSVIAVDSAVSVFDETFLAGI